MDKSYRFLAFDLGAESGRAVYGVLEEGRMNLEVVHRFRTEGLMMLGVRQWDVARIYEELCEGLAQCVRLHGPDLDGIGVDTWGVDFGLLDKTGMVLANPRHYRDKANEGMQDEAFRLVPRADLYKATGIQFLPFNSVYQLLSYKKAQSPVLDIASSLLLMGDLFGYLLSGVQACEYTNASTTQMLNPYTRQWDHGLLEKLGLPAGLLLDPVAPGTILGPVREEICAQTGLRAGVPVIAPGTHDTASAVAAVPVSADEGAWAYLSSGTWSLLGAELDEPHISEASLEQDFTNEGGVGGKIRFLKNIFGLWLVQECRRAWEREDGDTVDYGVMTAEAEKEVPFRSLINLDDERLIAPDDMPALIQSMCREGGYPVPETRGAIIRCALESLALKYRMTLRNLDRLLDRKTTCLHIIGGGVQNRLLCQMTADACGIPVVAGPIEATALGNLGVQAMAVGALSGLEALRAVVGRSVELERYDPRHTEAWDRLDC
ncbi:MAG: rhamnulokinase [Candidatus Hydrogenedentes bacterium]|nr:rhamnulokinase [Candidatus Hydrogenedentota bacterium]